MEGKVGNNISIVLDMVVTGEKVGGYYYYFFDDQSGDASWIHYGKSMPVYGTYKKDSIIEFREFNPAVTGAIFKGILKDGMISGLWTSSDGRKQLPFEASESYPSGTMAFRVMHHASQSPLFKKPGSPTASLEMSLLLPGGDIVDAVSDSVEAFIYREFFSDAIPGQYPENLLNTVKELFIKNYKSANEDIYQEGAASFNWEKIKEVRILHNEHDVLSLENYDYGFTGGAHGLSFSKFQVIDLKDGHRISLDEIFRDGYRNDLRDIINQEARDKYNLKRDQSLVDAGFYNEFIDPSDNFYLTKDGIGFYYNQYEVAPFAIGSIDIFISYNKIKRILSKESPVIRLINVP
ncbi:MAG: DUF3298 and DUF4163 domain-containing protein [Bacteroidales bacterium]|nr:DUF3298 and DUF4163 domain-containing protein [Bacteroidales bacterium]